jgi:GTP-binding protein Era
MSRQRKPRFSSGFVSLLGRPNVGKSTLLNALLGQKVAIVADKPQTTRTAIQGVLTQENAQVVFLDTPGIHEGESLINRQMMKSVSEALEERDLLVWVADATSEVTREEERALDHVRRAKTPTILALNKIDRIRDRHSLLPKLERFGQLHDFAEYVPISAAHGEGLDILLKAIIRRLPHGPAYFPPDHLTELPERFLAAELVREKALALTRQEVPHSLTSRVETWEEKGKLVRIAVTLFVERPGQKAILIGAGGSLLKTIGQEARLDIEKMLERRVYLELFVKVQPKWRENPEFLKDLDWRSISGGPDNDKKKEEV